MLEFSSVLPAPSPYHHFLLLLSSNNIMRECLTTVSKSKSFQDLLSLRMLSIFGSQSNGAVSNAVYNKFADMCFMRM